MSTEVQALWDIALNCVCPSCKKYVDLLEAPDFWDGRKLKPIEHHTTIANDLEVVCPNCVHEFKVCCDY